MYQTSYNDPVYVQIAYHTPIKCNLELRKALLRNSNLDATTPECCYFNQFGKF